MTDNIFINIFKNSYSDQIKKEFISKVPQEKISNLFQEAKQSHNYRGSREQLTFQFKDFFIWEFVIDGTIDIDDNVLSKETMLTKVVVKSVYDSEDVEEIEWFDFNPIKVPTPDDLWHIVSTPKYGETTALDMAASIRLYDIKDKFKEKKISLKKDRKKEK